MSSRSARALHILTRSIAGAAATTLVATGLIAGAALPASAAPSAGSIIAQGQTALGAGRYIVRLVDNAAATYEGGVNGLAPTKPAEGDQLNSQRRAVTSYTDYLGAQQKDVAASVGADVGYSYTLAINAFSADLTADQAALLQRDKRVVALNRDELLKPTAVPSTEFLGLTGPAGVWAATGGVDTAGAGVVLGVLDTGIAPENPSFAGDALGTTPGTAPFYSAPGVTSFEKVDGSTFTGACETGVQFTTADCSTKIVGARYFLDGFGAANLGSVADGEFPSPRDGDGHGSHTGSTAVGNDSVEASASGQDFGAISGVAPAAKIAAYKVCWSGTDPASGDDDGCTTTDSLAAIEAAVADGVDVINFSIGGGAATTTVSPTDLAFLGAAAAGVFVAVSAGNDGPTASSTDHGSPWYTSVAASTIPSYEATATLGTGIAYAGASVTVDLDPAAPILTAPLVTATSVALAGATSPNLCLADTLDPALVAGNIVVCERGSNARVAKSAEVARAGGVGVILVNVIPGSVDLDAHSVPTIHLNAQFHDAVLAYASTPGATVTFTPGNSTGVTPPTPQVAGFSSRGPLVADGGDILKPDITAPGVAILAAGPNAAGEDPTWEFLSGTSMSSPHIAGLAVLYLGESPNATPAEIKSAMMTTAYSTVDASGAPMTDPFVQGAGHVDPTKFFAPGLLYLNGLSDWLSYIEGAGYDVLDPAVLPIDPSNLNLASIAIGALTAPETITRTVTSTQAGTFTAAVQELAGITSIVSPSTLTFGAAGESASYSVTFIRTDAPLDTFTTGSLTWTSGSTVVRSPIAIQPVTIVAPANAEGVGISGSTAITVTPGGTGDIPLSTTGLAKGILQADPTGKEKEHSGAGVTGDVFEYTVEVPAGATYARFDLDSIDETADLDLTALLLDDNGEPVGGYSSATGSADERIDILAPDAGVYALIVDVYSANPATAFDLSTYVIASGGAPLTLAPSVLAAQAGVPVSYTASWAGLDARSRYLAQIAYGDTGASTLLEVVTGEPAPIATVKPRINGKPAVGKTLRATTGTWNVKGLAYAYQWSIDGVAVADATASTYPVVTADQGKKVTVTVTATGEGIPAGTATSAPVTVAFDTKVTGTVSDRFARSFNQVKVRITVTSLSTAPATGVATVWVDGKKHGSVRLTAADAGYDEYKLPKFRSGLHAVKISFAPDTTAFVGSTSSTRHWRIIS